MADKIIKIDNVNYFLNKPSDCVYVYSEKEVIATVNNKGTCWLKTPTENMIYGIEPLALLMIRS